MDQKEQLAQAMQQAEYMIGKLEAGLLLDEDKTEIWDALVDKYLKHMR